MVFNQKTYETRKVVQKFGSNKKKTKKMEKITKFTKKIIIKMRDKYEKV